MSNPFFQFKKFTVNQDRCAMKVTTDACLFGAWVANEIQNEELPIENCLDIGSGTGLLSLMVAQKIDPPVVGIEMDKDSFDQSKENIAASPFAEKISLFHGDARKFEFVHKYHVIFSNPPFYENELQSDDPKKNLALHSEELSLNELFEVISNNLSVDGIFFLLLPYKRQDEVNLLLKTHNFELSQIVFVRQSVKHDYFRIMLKGRIKKRKRSQFFFNDIAIWNERREYTYDFRELLRDYYLYL